MNENQKAGTGEGYKAELRDSVVALRNDPALVATMNRLVEDYDPQSGQWVLRLGNRMVISTKENGGYSSRLYVNNGETATSTAAKHSTLAGIKVWACKVLTS